MNSMVQTLDQALDHRLTGRAAVAGTPCRETLARESAADAPHLAGMPAFGTGRCLVLPAAIRPGGSGMQAPNPFPVRSIAAACCRIHRHSANRLQASVR
jgi:hypothetical protein